MNGHLELAPPTPSTGSPVFVEEEKPQKRLTLRDTFQDSQLVDAFMKHLAHEFSCCCRISSLNNSKD